VSAPRSQLATMSRSRLLTISLFLCVSFAAWPTHDQRRPYTGFREPETATFPETASNRASRPIDFRSSDFPNSDFRGSDDNPLAPTFRLGTAAGPFGWSTAIADFNTDGTPDLVIADRAPERSNVYGYLIQFSVSGRESKKVAFESAQSGLTVSVSDFDHDNDLDVVVRAVLSREIVGVWLNDGRGHFQHLDDRSFTSGVQELRSIAAADASVDQSIAGLLPRSADGLSVLFRAVSPPSPGPLLTASSKPSLVTVHSAAVAPRGPPRQPA
jgi:hypothetical protein